MTAIAEKIQFVATVAGEAAKFEKLMAVRDARARALDDVVGGGFSDEDRSELRKLMTFSVKRKGVLGGTVQSMDKEGQRHSIETEDVKDYKSLSDEDWKKINQAMQKILAMKEKLLAQKGPDGAPLFTIADLADELFTPLVREGLMPETLVLDEHSQTAKLLKATFESYKQMLSEARKEKELKAAKTESDAAGAGSKLDMLKAKKSQLVERVERVKDKTIGQVIAGIGLGETEEDRKRVTKIGMQAIKTANKTKGAVTKVIGLPEELQESLKDPGQWTAGIEYLKGNTAPVEEIMQQQAQQDPEQTMFFSNLASKLAQAFPDSQEQQIQVMEALAQKLDEDADAVKKFLSSQPVEDTKTIAKDSKALVVGQGKQVLDIVLKGIDLGKLKHVIADAGRETALQAGAAGALAEIDTALTTALSLISPVAGSALSGAFADAVDEGDLVEQGMAKAPNPDNVIHAVASGLEKALAGASTGTDTAGAFRAAAKKLSAAFSKAVGKTTLAGALAGPPSQAFGPLVDAGKAAADSMLNDKEFVAALQSDSARKALEEKGQEQNEYLEDELLKSQEEIQDFERELVLVDEGGMDMAKQRSIAALITKLQHDRQVLEMVASLGTSITGVLGGGTKLGTDIFGVVQGGGSVAAVGTKTAVSQVGASVTSALSAAQLIIKLSVNAIKAAERWRLWYKFRGDVEKALKAKSALQSSIENFFNNKKEQIAFHTIEDAMLAIQLAGSIASTVPHPISMAVGSTLTAVGTAGEQANKLAQMGYDEVQLRRGWKHTREALNNPKNRRAGLQALHDNATLAVHSIAWAAMQGDPIAEQIMRSCGVSAQTLAESDTDQKAVIQYLETLLAEDRQLKDVEKVNTKWKPKIELTLASWFATKHRAQTKATPKLKAEDTPAIDTAFKQVQAQKRISDLQASLEDVTVKELETYLAQATALAEALQKYAPKTDDGTSHDEMLDAVKEFQELAEDRVYQLQRLKAEREHMWVRGKVPVGR